MRPQNRNKKIKKIKKIKDNSKNDPHGFAELSVSNNRNFFIATAAACIYFQALPLGLLGGVVNKDCLTFLACTGQFRSSNALSNVNSRGGDGAEVALLNVVSCFAKA